MPVAEESNLCRQTIADVPVRELAEKFGTPCYVYDEKKIVERIEDLRRFDLIRYAQKACSNIAILDLVRRHGVFVDAVSAGEIHRATKAGYELTGDPHPVVYTADIFDHDALSMVVENGMHVNAGSPDMLAQLGERAPGSKVTLRINPGFGHGHNQKTNTGGEQSKHGIWHEDLDYCVELASKFDLTISGLHMHIGSGTDLEHLAQVCGAMETAVKKVGSSITTISAGGGLPIAYKAEDSFVDLAKYFQLWDDTRQRLQTELGHSIQLEIEPGRYLSAESGYLVTEIRAIKQMGKNQYYLVDAGFNNLARPILYGSYHPMSIVPISSSTSTNEEEGRPMRDVIIGGPLCESGDIFTQEEGGFVCSRKLPEAKVGDFLVIECAGAYGYVMSSNYNSKPFVAEALIRDGKPHLIRERQSLDDLIRGEHIPSDA